MNTSQYLESVTDRLYASASVQTIFGKPFTVGERTVLPVARVGYGFGGGHGRKGLPGIAETDPQSDVSGGGGGGVGARPLGVFEITSERIRFIPASSWRNDVAILIACAFAGFVLGRRASR